MRYTYGLRSTSILAALANALKDTGYETAITGKWHLGEFEPAYRPTARGFDFLSDVLQLFLPDA